MLGTTKDTSKEKTIVKTTEKFRIFSKAIKWIFIVIFSILGLYLLYLAFGFYIYGSFILSFVLSSIILYNTIEVPSDRYVESRIEENFDEKGVSKGLTHVFNEYDIPTDLSKDFTFFGDNVITWKSKNGKNRILVEKIDFIKKEITFAWFNKLSHWAFLVEEKTWLEMNSTIKQLQREKLSHPDMEIIRTQSVLLEKYKEMNDNPDEYDDALEGLYERMKKRVKEENQNDI